MPDIVRRAGAMGFCYGVSRAVDMALALSKTGRPTHTWGPLVHNRRVVERLTAGGVTPVERLEDCVPGQTVLIRSHGVSPAVHRALEEAGHPVVDATCPCVRRVQTLVRTLEAEGRRVFILGDEAHPEVRGIVGWCGDPVVVENGENLENWLRAHPRETQKPVAMVAQTTALRVEWEICVQILKKLCTNVKIIDTICSATTLHQSEADKLARACEVVVVAGDRASSNTRKLLEVCAAHCSEVFLVEDANGWLRGRLRNQKKVGLTAGASTPPWIIEEVYQAMSEEIRSATEESAAPVGDAAATESAAPVVPTEAPVSVEATSVQEAPEVPGEEEESFASMLEKSLKTISTGDKVRGVVTAITPTEVHVDLGTKHAGYIPIAELTDDPEEKIENLVRVGEEIETYAMRVNDVEGTVVLSRRRLDTVRGWEDIEQARESRAILSGIVTEENKGGIVVSVRGVRVFVPASQTGLPKDTPMSTLLKKRVKLRVSEVNRVRRRVVGSIRAVQADERRAMADAIWESIEVGKHYEGVVKSLTSYGAFVDIGGVDGMVHVSEISWSRVRHPSEALSVGDGVDVHVVGFDKEKRKISLSCKKLEENPWHIFKERYHTGDVVEVRVVKLMQFGAFAEVLPGVDGLIHIGQITDRRIGKPGDVLTEGQTVKVKITAIDDERRKISLSIRALLEPPAEPATQEDLDNAALPDEIVAVSGEPVPAPPLEVQPAPGAPEPAPVEAVTAPAPEVPAEARPEPVAAETARPADEAPAESAAEA
ncbi:MAG: bifunctional 4-hydroxy-3-methylbut-2-enyl diphosphate reductase/30S ribosomal protein S1 [Oscillospiraceae bacterium]|nr:bifunctional 4-hydroxy-3-methylbut-2-enyl diphosphate reductase/30S ribosomal protein S1 [Oscillospiraceae bacterium]